MSFSKLRILLWKNWVLQKRRPISGVLQIVIPVLIVLFAAWLKSSVEDFYEFYDSRYEGEFSLSNFSMCNVTLEKVFYAPDNEAYNRLITKAFEDQNFEIRGFEDRGLMNDELNNENIVSRDSIVRIVLESDSVVTTELPKNLTHNARVASMRVEDITCNMVIQNQLERAFVQLTSNLPALEPVLMRSFPFDDYFTQLYTIFLLTSMPFFLVLTSFLMVGTIIKSIASERENRVKELMKIMGLSNQIYWLSWFIKCKIMTIITYTLVTVFLCVPVFGTAIFERSNFFIIWLFLFIYSIGVITFCFMVSTFFQKSSSAAVVGVMLFFTTFIPYYVYGSDFADMNYAVKWFFLLPINTAFGQGIFMTLAMELNRKGIVFSNLFSHYEAFSFSLGELMIVMLIASIIHVLLTLYIELVFPGDVGVAKPWHFPVTSLIKMIRKSNDKTPTHFVNNEDSTFVSRANFEEEPKHLNAKVRVVNMTKKFGSFTAVKNFSLNIYEDQITVLLGHNGGGKTTTMNVLTGILPPTHGTAFINGFDIRTDIVDARKSLGICPQHNILFNDMTVSEHIIFFCKLKGIEDKKAIEHEVTKYLSLMDFMDKKNELSKTLSGGQKRKLSIANALCGNSQFVVLDEPTSGLDVNARRKLWDLLIEEKRNRTMLLTTHYMDEAEVLGDRIAIMSDGELRTVGTSFFLKKKFGSGYRLIVVKAPNCDATKILDVLKTYAPDSTIESEEQLEVTFILSDEYLDKFQMIFKHLEDNLEALRIQSLGCSLASLEEVFLKVGEDHVVSDDVAVKFNNLMSFSKVSTGTLIINQIYAMILKKIHFTRRNYVPLIVFTILTAWFIFIFLFAPMGGPSGSISFFPDLSGIVEDESPDNPTVKSYKNLFGNHLIEFTDLGISDFIFRNFLTRNQRYQIGATFRGSPNIVWHNFHSGRGNVMPTALNFYYRAILHGKMGTDYDIRLQYYPFDYEYNFPDSNSRNQSDDIMVYIMFFFVLMYWVSMHITLKIKERVSKAKLLQFISGVNRVLFTLTSFFLDSLISICIVFVVLGIVVATGRDGFSTFDDVSVYLLVFPLYIANVVSIIYIMSFWFTKHSTGESLASYFPVGVAFLYIPYIILDQLFLNAFANAISSIIYYVLIFFAPFSLVDIYGKLQGILLFKNGEIWSFGERGMGINAVCMAAGTLIFLTLILLKDYSVFTWIRYKLSDDDEKQPPISISDDDVLAEIDRVRAKSAKDIIDSNLVLRGLTKKYGQHLAVNQLYVGVEPAECFGLLGVNGAGKTTVFKMLTGDELITAGHSWVRGYSLKTEKSKVYRDIGYCPQYDALLNELTGRETMKIFCLLRGVPRNQIDDITEAFAAELDFSKYLDVQVGAYSGGNKRKLSASLSLLGNLSLVFLDECSSGIDARAKRQLWDAIKKARNAGKSIVISSHSMQECESLCTRLAIMVDGEFHCIGSIQHIKNKFSRGFILKILMANRDDEYHFNAILQRVTSTFPHSILKERFMGLLTFHIDVPELKWSEVFAELSKIKMDLGIYDYTLTQASLESVFLFFSQRGKRKIE